VGGGDGCFGVVLPQCSNRTNLSKSSWRLSARTPKLGIRQMISQSISKHVPWIHHNSSYPLLGHMHSRPPRTLQCYVRSIQRNISTQIINTLSESPRTSATATNPPPMLCIPYKINHLTARRHHLPPSSSPRQPSQIIQHGTPTLPDVGPNSHFQHPQPRVFHQLVSQQLGWRQPATLPPALKPTLLIAFVEASGLCFW
jgi:hypothetical protein